MQKTTIEAGLIYSLKLNIYIAMVKVKWNLSSQKISEYYWPAVQILITTGSWILQLNIIAIWCNVYNLYFRIYNLHRDENHSQSQGALQVYDIYIVYT